MNMAQNNGNRQALRLLIGIGMVLAACAGVALWTCSCSCSHTDDDDTGQSPKTYSAPYHSNVDDRRGPWKQIEREGDQPLGSPDTCWRAIDDDRVQDGEPVDPDYGFVSEEEAEYNDDIDDDSFDQE